MGAVQGKRTVFSTYIGGQQWPTQSQPRHFQSGAKRWPCYLHPLGVPTHLPLSHPFCCRRTYLQRSLQEVTSQDDRFTPDISGYLQVDLNYFLFVTKYSSIHSVQTNIETPQHPFSHIQGPLHHSQELWPVSSSGNHYTKREESPLDN